METNKIVLSVSQVNEYISLMFKSNPVFDNIYLRGEISNVSLSRGAYYFNIKDSESGVTSQISAIMFGYTASRLSFKLEDGMKVEVRGKIQVYVPSGRYSIIVEDLEQEGIGILFKEFLELKEKLYKEGLFDESHKREIPKYPNTVAIITSKTGDAVHDIINTFKKRFPLTKLILFPCLVQGPDAPKSLINALKEVYNYPNIDALIIGRGGGSFEDLSCFNDEELVRTLYNSPIPTVTGIGHEPDMMICDFVSDYRAPTPTGAATALSKDINECRCDLINYKKLLKDIIIKKLTDSFNKYKQLSLTLESLSPINLLKMNIEKLNNIKLNLFNNYSKLLDYKDHNFHQLVLTLELNNPLSILNKGYSIVKQDNRIIKSIKEIDDNKNLNILLNDGELTAKVIKGE